ncbi:MAG: GNAT family N-acetyltransferase [Desulfomonilaceae bacterium]|nr:GNAT family N-acetyltransferase [Desulfomonilaceae bacterium]
MAVEGKFTSFTDKQGDRYDLAPFAWEHRKALTEMYDSFTPKAITQGLPPADARARGKWIAHLLDAGENFLAWQGDKVVGHSCLIPESDGHRGEYVIFVDKQYRNRGLGIALTRLAVHRAEELKMEAVWLTVEALNFKAIKLYKRIGFVFCDTGERERTMILRL